MADADVRVALVGAFTVTRAGQVIEPHQLGSRKARVLLKVLAGQRGRLVPADLLAEAVWGDAPPDSAPAGLATLVSRLRSVLGRATIEGGRHGYRLAVGTAVALDVDEAERLAATAEARLSAGQPALAVTAARALLDVVGTGAVVEDEPGVEWAADVGRATARLARRARAVAWDASDRLGDHRAALAAAQDAAAADPLDEEAQRAVILAYHRLGEPGEALAAYARLRAVLAEDLGADPGPATEALYAAVLQGEDVPAVSAPGSPAPGPARVGFAGRDDELARLLAAWAGAIRGETACVLVTGDGGIGKSRLAAEAAADARAGGALVLTAECFQAERSLFLQPVVEVVRAVVASQPPDVVRRAAGDRAGALASLVSEADAVLRPLGYEPAAGEIERRRIFEAVAGLLGGLAERTPVLVVLEDLHQAGASTVELVHFVLRWNARAPLMVMATVREDAADAVVDQLGALAQVVHLEALSAAAVRSLARDSGLADAADAVMHMTGGHTLFVVEALRALSDARAAGEAVDGEALRVPESLRSAVTLRLRRCGPAVDDLLRAAVVVGSSFELAPVADMLGVDVEEAARRGQDACRAGLLVESGTGYRFANDLVRDVIYDTTPAPVRAIRHRRLAAVLAADRPEAAAGHAAASDDWRGAVVNWLAAADQAAAAFANREALDLLGHALDACALLDEPRLTAEVQLARGRAHLALGDYGGAARDLTVAQQMARAVGDGAVEAVALTELGWAAYHERLHKRAHDLAERAAAHPQAGPRAAILVARNRNADGDLATAGRLLEPLAADSDPAARAMALSCLATVQAHAGRFPEARRTADRAVEACLRTGVLRGLLNARMFGALTRTNLGDYAGALEEARALLADVARYDATFYHSRGLNVLAGAWRELGEPGRSADLAAEALEASTGSRLEGEPAANALLALAESALVAGDEGEAGRRLGDLAPLRVESVGFGWRIDLLRLEMLTRMDGGAGADPEELLARASAHGATKYEALALAALGRVDDAVAAARRTGSPALVARVAPAPLARQQVDAIAAGLPPELRDGFVRRGPLAARSR